MRWIFYAGHYSGLYTDVAQIHGCFAHDLLACMVLVNPEPFTLQSGRVRVLTDGLTQGQTVMKRNGEAPYPHPGWGPDIPDTQVGLQVDAEACKAVFERDMMAPWLAK